MAAATWMRAGDMRSLGSFDAKSQVALKAGKPIKAGDGRTFQLMNGHLVSVGSPTWKKGLEIRSAGATKPAAAPVAKPAAAPVARPATTESGRPTVPFMDPPTVRNAPATTTAAPGSSGFTLGGAGVRVPRGDDPSGRGPTVPQGATGEQKDSYIRLQETLDTYGISGLATTVYDWIIDGKSEAEIDRDIRQTPEFKTEFPEIELRAKAGLSAKSPGEIVSYRAKAAEMMRQFGLPKGFYDNKSDFTKLFAGDVSLAELSDRVQTARDAVYTSSSEEMQVLRRDYLGSALTEGDMIAFFLNPDKAQPLLEKQVAAARIGGAAFRSGFGDTTREQNERVGSLGVSADQAQQGFSELAGQRELFQSLDSTEDVITTDQQIGLAFGGDANQRRRADQRRRKRQAAFDGGGGFATSQQGVVGLADTR